MFDPAVMVDDDGTGYLAFGGGVPAGQDLNPQSARIVKLADNMTSLADDEDGIPKMIDAPCMFEDGGIHKANGKYYYTYCSNFSGDHSAIPGYPGYGIICCMVSDDPMGPYTYVGEILQNPSYYFNVGGNNHMRSLSLTEQPTLPIMRRPLEKPWALKKDTVLPI